MKNKKLLFSFIWYCLTHRNERFWQSLRNWSNAPFIYKGYVRFTGKDLVDTYYKEDK